MVCFIVFLDIENIWFDTRIKSLAEILRKILFNLSPEQLTAILFYAYQKFPQECQSGTRLILIYEGSVNLNKS